MNRTIRLVHSNKAVCIINYNTIKTKGKSKNAPIFINEEVRSVTIDNMLVGKKVVIAEVIIQLEKSGFVKMLINRNEYNQSIRDIHKMCRMAKIVVR